MMIFVNSKEQEIPDGASLPGLIEILNLTNKRVAIEVNQELVVKMNGRHVF